jgi:hypothetical protein
MHAMGFEPLAIRVEKAFRAGGADIAHIGAAFDQQPRDQQLRAFIARERDAALDRAPDSAPRMAGKWRSWPHRSLSGATPQALADGLEPGIGAVKARPAPSRRPGGRRRWNSRTEAV